jgi:hypothetical protein
LREKEPSATPSRVSRHASTLVVLLLVVGSACSRRRSARATADYFVDKYYIEIDHAAALEVAEGMVADRLKSEQALVAAAQSQGVGPTQVLPRVFYTVKSEAQQDGNTRVVYSLSIDSAGDKMRKEVTILVARRADDFHVIGWTERDEPTGADVKP